MTLRDELAAIGAALHRLATTEEPWPKATLDDVRAITGRIDARVRSEPVDHAAVVDSLLRISTRPRRRLGP